jgi:hypothetical protein
MSDEPDVRHFVITPASGHFKHNSGDPKLQIKQGTNQGGGCNRSEQRLLLCPSYGNNVVLSVFFADLERSLELWRVAPTL